MGSRAQAGNGTVDSRDGGDGSDSGSDGRSSSGSGSGSSGEGARTGVATAPAGVVFPDEETFTMPAAWRRIVLPRRGGIPVAVEALRPEAAKTLARRRREESGWIEEMLASPESDPEVCDALRAHLGGSPDPLGAAVLVHLTVEHGLPDGIFVDAWFQTHGPAFAARAVVEHCGVAAHYKQAGSHRWDARLARRPLDRAGTDWLGRQLADRLRALLSVAREDDYRQAVAALAAARRTRARGFTARLHRPTPDAPSPRADLPSCTVSFPVPHEPAYALTDAAESVRGEVVTLAVWAFRAGDTEGTDQVSVGGRTAAGTAAEDDGVRPDRHPTATTGHAPATPTAAQPANATARHHAATVTPSPPASPGGPGADPLRGAVALADELLLDGVRQAGPVFGAALRRSQEALAGARLHWPAGAVAELREQVEAYAARGTRYDPERFARLLAELHARQRAGGRDPGAVLGTEEAPSTPLRRVRLVALGCRIGGSDRDRTAETYFAHPDAAIVLVLRKRWESAEGQEPTGHDLAGRRLLGAPLRALAAANVVSERTARSADRTITVARGRIAAAGVTPVGSAWTELPEALLLRDAAAHLRSLGDRPPRLVRPRVEAESVRVVEVAAVEAVGYDPARQVLEAVLRDPAGTEVVVRAEHNPLCPARLDALAAALGDGDTGPVRCVSGMLHRDRGRIVLDPLAVLTPAGVVVPDLAPGEGAGALPPAAATPADPLTGALAEALAALADAAHHGLRHLAPAARGRLAGAADRLHRTGLHTAARHLRALAAALRDQGPSAAPPVWVTAYVRLSATLEAHRESRPA